MQLDTILITKLLRQLSDGTSIDLSEYDREVLLDHRIMIVNNGWAIGVPLPGDDKIVTMKLKELTPEGREYLRLAQAGSSEAEDSKHETISLDSLPQRPLTVNLTDEQWVLLGWLVQAHQSGELESEFLVGWTFGGPYIPSVSFEELPSNLTKGHLEVLADEGYVKVWSSQAHTYHVVFRQAAFDIFSPPNRSSRNASHLVARRDFIDDYFNMDEFRSLCFEMYIDFDNLGGETKSGKALSLVSMLDRSWEIPRLDARLKALRPKAFVERFGDTVD